MRQPKIITKRVVSPDGRIVAEARSVVFDDEDDNATSHQTVHTGYSDNSVWCHSSAFSSNSSTSISSSASSSSA